MKEHPILFSTPMVQAILESRKTQTRRTTNLDVVNECPDEWIFEKTEVNPEVEFCKDFKKSVKKLTGIFAKFSNKRNGNLAYCKFQSGQPGDLLWVRESWIEDPAGKKGLPKGYCADYNGTAPFGIKKPSIHLKKKYARIWLQVEEIRVERLQDISEEDAKAEGVEPGRLFGFGAIGQSTFREGFFNTWMDIYGMESLHENPWVWVVKFKVVSMSGKPER